MLRSIADGVLIHQSRFVQSNAVVVQGRDGVLLIDPGVHDDEMACSRQRPPRTGPACRGGLLDASALGSSALGHAARHSSPFRHGAGR